MIDAFRKCEPNVGGIWALNTPPENATILQKLEQGLLNYTQRKSIGQDITAIGCGGSCFKREAIRGLKFDESVVAGEDALFCKVLTKKGWKLRVVPVKIEHVKPRGFSDWIKSEFYGGVGYVQVGGSLVYSIKRLLGSPFRGLQLSLHYHNPLFFFYYPFRLLIWFSGISKAFFTSRKPP
jgi:cellulose synthase/poly-beta-1,6-N-acetylglucosamine synthase-like glycosyltransferase